MDVHFHSHRLEPGHSCGSVLPMDSPILAVPSHAETPTPIPWDPLLAYVWMFRFVL